MSVRQGGFYVLARQPQLRVVSFAQGLFTGGWTPHEARSCWREARASDVQRLFGVRSMCRNRVTHSRFRFPVGFPMSPPRKGNSPNAAKRYES